MSTRVSCRLSLPACFLVLASGMACCPLASDALSVDINSRESVRAFYNTYYTASDAAKRLVKAGFKHVSVLDGGIGAWQSADLPLVKGRN